MIVKKITVLMIVSFVVLGSLALLYSGGQPHKGDSGGKLIASQFTTIWNGSVTINPDGSISSPAAPIQYVDGQYLLTGNINGTVSVEKSNTVLNGNGYNITNYGFLVPLQVNSVNNVTLENTNLISMWAPAIGIYLSSYDTVINNTITGMNNGIFVNTPYNAVLNNTVKLTLTNPNYTGTPYGIITHASDTKINGNNVYIPIHSFGLIADGQESQVINNTVVVIGPYSSAIYSSSPSNIIAENNVNSSGEFSYGIQLATGSQYGNISKNIVKTSGDHSIAMSVSDGLNTVSQNTINETGNFSKGIYIPTSGTGSNTIALNNITLSGSNSAGIYSNSYDSGLMNNTVNVTGNLSYGIDTLSLEIISGNVITVNGNNVYGLYSGTNNRIISGNSIVSSGNSSYGLYVSEASYLTVSENNITASGNHANATYVSGDNSYITGNNITAGMENGTGFNLAKYSDYNVVSNNTVEFSSIGLWASVTTGDTFTGNTFLNDTGLFRFTNTNNNMFYHNNFINYSTYTISTNTHSTWDNGYPAGGNYWFSYAGVDLFSGPGQNISGSDGIGDTQFNVTSNNIDHYPLMKNWSLPTMTFTESGLATGTEWSINFSGSNISSSSSTIVIPISIGVYTTYNYSFNNVSGYVLSQFAGQFVYSGNSGVAAVQYTAIAPPPPPPVIPGNYTITFIEQGLPSQTNWSVALNGSDHFSTSNLISIMASNGTYEYSIGGISGYAPSTSTGYVTISGSNVTVDVNFTQVMYEVTFNSLGLPSGIIWYVNFTGGNSFLTSGSTISVSLPNGTYQFTVSNVTGYNVSASSESVTINGSNPNPITVSYAAQNSTSNNNPPPSSPGINPWIYLILGLIGGAAVTTAVLEIYHRRK